MKQKLNLLALSISLLFFVSCDFSKQKDTHKNETKHAENHTANKDCSHVHWSHHTGEEGPENWKNLCDGFADCGGDVQSPINIVTKSAQTDNKLLAPVFNYGTSKVAIINNGHTVQFNISGDNQVTLEGKDYKLLQFHYHALSEHTIDGKHAPIEVHFVHKHSNTDYAVLGVMFEEGKENPLFSKYLEHFPKKEGHYNSEDKIDVLSLLPQNKSYYNYKGSLTTPPCSEVVNWYVLKTPVTASKSQIEQLSKILNNNFRPVQPIKERTVLSYNN